MPEAKEVKPAEGRQSKIKEARWDKAFEKPLYEKWKKERTFAFDPKSKGKIYAIDTPPPYVNAPIHIGQASTYILQDVFARFRRMAGWNVLFPLGLDRNGLPIEVAAEKRFKTRFGEVPREKFIEMCRTVLEEASLASTDTFWRSGISFSGWEPGEKLGDAYQTDSPAYRAMTQATFIELWKKGLIYEATIINNYCPGCKTTLADAEIEYKEEPTQFNDVTFKVKETGEKIVIGTTRPELMGSCAMVIYNPEDKRYQHLKGKHAIVPIFEQAVPIMPHPAAEMDKGTGLVMMCSAGDIADIRFFREQKLKPKISIGQDGRMNEHAGQFKGLKIKEARAAIIEELKNRALLVKQAQVMHRIPVCERSGDHIEFIELPELYLKQLEFKDKLRKLAEEMSYFAPQSKQLLIDWIDAVALDWPISRKRYYATEIPLWYCKPNRHAVVPQAGSYYQPWREKAPVKKCPECGATDFEGETRVFDTWFDSANSPLWVTGWHREPKFFEQAFPAGLRPQGKEIVRTWLYYTMLKSFLLTGKQPFQDVWIHYHITDEKGHKMSKSKGNVIDPKDILDKYGAEPFRFWAAAEGNITTTDLMVSYQRIDGAGKTINKLWNVARFVGNFEAPVKLPKLQVMDYWVLGKLAELVQNSRKWYEEYDAHNVAIAAREFLWNTFASDYIEIAKSRAYADDAAAAWTLNRCLDRLLLVLSPILPFASERLYQELRGKPIHAENWSVIDPKLLDKDAQAAGEIAVALIRAVRNWKHDSKLPLNAELSKLTVEAGAAERKMLESALDDVKGVLKAGEIRWGKGQMEVPGTKLRFTAEPV